MGLIRFFLAAAVVLWHAPSWGQYDLAESWLMPLHPFFAVQVFFVISGFYMQLIWTRYESAGKWLFYSNRYSRLIVSYLVVFGTTLALSVALPQSGFPAISFHSGGPLQAAYLAITSLTIFGMDTVELVKQPWSAGFLVPQGWSLGAELWFYLLVPFLAPLRTRWLVAVLLGSLALKAGIAAFTTNFYPWNQRFFPAELMFFITGMLACRLPRATNRIVGYGAVAIASVIVLFSFSLTGAPTLLTSVILAASFYVLLPAIFHATAHNKLDRLIGELSYPIYLWHITIGYFIPVARESGILLLGLSIAASLPLMLLIEVPMEKWRAIRLRRASYSDAAEMNRLSN